MLDPEENQFLSVPFLMKKRDGVNRLVVNIKGLNSNISYQHLKMQWLLISKEMLFSGHKICKIDRKVGYFVFAISRSNEDNHLLRQHALNNVLIGRLINSKGVLLEHLTL